MVDEEFVDFYQILELPLDADRNAVRKRINALYLDAQGNLDHRNFETRLKYQKLFESTLPQARFVLLDDARRAEYTALVRAFRVPAGESAGLTLPPPPRQAPRPSAPRESSREAPNHFFRPSEQSFEEPIPSGREAQIEPLPTARPAAEQLQTQREELWKKWKMGLEDALAQEKSPAAKEDTVTRRAAPSDSNSASIPQNAARVSLPGTSRQQETTSTDSRQFPVVAEALSAAQIEARRIDHRREVTREMLVNVSLLWGSMGALLVIVPGVAALVAFMGRNYPRGAPALLGFNSTLLWLLGFTLIAVSAVLVSQALSKAMRRKKALELAALSYEELLRRSGNVH